MFTDVLNHPSMPVSGKCTAAPADTLFCDELPALLRQSLLIWEQIFDEQTRALRKHATPEAVEPAADVTSYA